MNGPPKVTRVNDAYERLKQEILQNRMPPGFQAPEPEIAQSLQMSRTPVREALVRLQSEGLVDLIPRRGVRVRPISLPDMQEIYQLLTLLEPEAAAQVARAGLSQEQLDELENITTEMESALKDDDLAHWADADDRFHRALLKCHDNKRLSAFVNVLFDQAHRARISTLYLRKPPHQSTAEHRVVLKAIIDRDDEQTRKSFKEHRQRTGKELLNILQTSRLTQL